MYVHKDFVNNNAFSMSNFSIRLQTRRPVSHEYFWVLNNQLKKMEPITRSCWINHMKFSDNNFLHEDSFSVKLCSFWTLQCDKKNLLVKFSIALVVKSWIKKMWYGYKSKFCHKSFRVGSYAKFNCRQRHWADKFRLP